MEQRGYDVEELRNFYGPTKLKRLAVRLKEAPPKALADHAMAAAWCRGGG